MTRRKSDEILLADELMEIECMHRQFPEHTYEEIVWAFRTCKHKVTAKSGAVLSECVHRKLKEKTR